MTTMEPTLPAPIPWRQRLMAGLETPLVQRTLIALILVNAVILGIETSPSAMKHWGRDESLRRRRDFAAAQ
jgi:voltage-gated sodium channel